MLKTRKQLTIRGNELFKSQERFAIQEKELSNSWERIPTSREQITRFDVTIYFS